VVFNEVVYSSFDVYSVTADWFILVYVILLSINVDCFIVHHLVIASVVIIRCCDAERVDLVKHFVVLNKYMNIH
jgi:hypothetical protein